MRKVLVVARRELGAYFNSPMAYIVVVFFLVLTSAWLFYGERFFARDAATLRGYFAAWPLLFIVLLPALTMRSWAEDRQGTARSCYPRFASVTWCWASSWPPGCCWP
jgi:ABC-2 type transport system permease protein